MSPDMPEPDILLIDLDRSKDRLAFQEEQFRRIGLTFERIAAVDGSLLADSAYRRRAYLWERPLSRGEVGCLLSHQACWLQVMKTGRDTLVFEDDVVLAPEIVALMGKAGAIGGSVAINLEARKDLKYLSVEPLALDGLGGWRVFEMLLGTTGTGTYLLTPKAAERLAADIERRGPIADIYMWNTPGIRLLQIDPGLAVPIDRMRGLFGRHLPFTGMTTILKSRDDPAMRVPWLAYPSFLFRRAVGQVRLAVTKLRLVGRSARRIVPPLQSIYTSYVELKRDPGA